MDISLKIGHQVFLEDDAFKITDGYYRDGESFYAISAGLFSH